VHPLHPMPRHHPCHFDRSGLPISCACSRQLPIHHPPLSFRPEWAPISCACCRQLPIRHPPLSFRPEWTDASLHLRSCEGVGPRSGEISLRFDRGDLCSPNATITTQLLKCRKFALYDAVSLPIFSVFQTLCSFAHFVETALSCYQHLTASFCTLFVTLRTSNPLFSTSCGLFCEKHRGWGVRALKKTRSVVAPIQRPTAGSRRQERLGPVPNDLYANADQQKRGQLRDHRHARSAQHTAHLAKCMSAGLPQVSRPPTSLVDR
jgi:hypothetical protein